MNPFSRLSTDPPSVNHEGDWEVWNWTGMVVLTAVAGLMVMGGLLAISYLWRLVSSNREFKRDDWWAVGLGILGVAGVFGLLWVVHGMARHTANWVGAVLLIVAVYVVTLLVAWLVGPAMMSIFLGGANAWDYWGGSDKWASTLRVAAVVAVVLASGNLLLESLNRASATIGLSISVIVVLALVGVGFVVMNAAKR